MNSVKCSSSVSSHGKPTQWDVEWILNDSWRDNTFSFQNAQIWYKCAIINKACQRNEISHDLSSPDFERRSLVRQFWSTSEDLDHLSEDLDQLSEDLDQRYYVDESLQIFAKNLTFEVGILFSQRVEVVVGVDDRDGGHQRLELGPLHQPLFVQFMEIWKLKIFDNVSCIIIK